MAKARYKRHKQVRQEQVQLQKAAGKRGLWATIGSALIGGLATLVTGGTAAPIVAGLMAGVGSAAGGHLGNYLAGQTKEGKLAGGRFFQGSRADLSSQIKEGIWTKAATAAIMAGAKQLGGKTKLSTTGDKLTTTVTDVGGTATKTATGEVAKSGFKLGDIFKRRVGAETAGATYATEAGGLKGAMAHLGKTIDIKGSTLGKGVGKLTGAYQPDVGWVTGADIGADLKNVLPTELHTATGVTGLDRVDPAYKNYQFGPRGTGTPGAGRMLYPVEESIEQFHDPSGSVAAFEKDQAMLDIAERHNLDVSKMLEGSKVPISESIDSTGLPGEKSLYGQYGSPEGSRPWSAHDVALQRGKESEFSQALTEGGAYHSKGPYGPSIVKEPTRPNVPIASEEIFLTEGEQLREDAYKTLDINQPGYSDFKVNRAFQKLQDYNAENTIESPGFSEFGNWEKPIPRPLEGDFQTTDPLQGMQQQMEDMPSSFRRGNLPKSYQWHERLFGGTKYENI